MNIEEVDEIKTILVGMTGAGKTNIINAMTNQPFKAESASTLTSSFVDKYIEINKKKYRVELWDTAGQEKYRSLNKIFINDSKIVIIVYDITTKESFQEVDYWTKTVKEILGDSPIYGLVGNKKDLYTKEQVDEETGRNKAKEINAIFKLTSAKNERGAINEYIKELLENYLKKHGEVVKKEKSIDVSIESFSREKTNTCC